MTTTSRMLSKHRELHELWLMPEAQRTRWQRLRLRIGSDRFDKWLSRRYGAFIHLGANLGANLNFGHELHGIHIGKAVIGDNVTIYQHVTIGHNHGKAPEIGNGVFIGANATLVGRCMIGDGAKIGAGVTLVDASVEPGAVIINKSAFDLTNGRFVRT